MAGFLLIASRETASWQDEARLPLEGGGCRLAVPALEEAPHILSAGTGLSRAWRYSEIREYISSVTHFCIRNFLLIPSRCLSLIVHSDLIVIELHAIIV